MKRFKFILLLLAGVIAACNFTACKDDDDKQNSIVGTWVSNDGSGYECYTFTANGEYTNEWRESSGKSGFDSGTYTYDGKNLTLRDSDGYSGTYSVTISGNQMVWNVDGERWVYIRK